MKKTIPVTRKEFMAITEYELAATWWTKYIPGDKMKSFIARRFMAKTARKLRRYEKYLIATKPTTK